MSEVLEVFAEDGTVTVRVPLLHRRRGGRKMVIGEVRSESSRVARGRRDAPHRTILKALGRAYRWKHMLESGEFNSISDLAAAEKINHSYVRCILRLTLLSPEITEQILDRRFTKMLRLEDLPKPVPEGRSELRVNGCFAPIPLKNSAVERAKIH